MYLRGVLAPLDPRAVALASSLAALCGCDVYDASLLDEGADAGRPPGCADRRTLPPRPTGPDGPDVGEITFALRDVVLQQDGDLWRTLGHDLDGLCTETADGPVECVPPRPGAEPEVDGEGGIDNAFGHRLYPVVQLVLPTLQEDARAAQQAGKGALLVRVRGWNGEDDDPQMDAIVSQTTFGTPGGADGSPPDDVVVDGFELRRRDGTPAPPPAWEGNDHWWVREDTFLRGDPEQPRVRDDRAYMTDRTAVIRLPDRVDIIFFAGEQSVVVRLTDAHSIGRLTEDATALEDVLVTGRWSIVDLIDTAERVGVCEGSAERRIVTTQLETIADVRSTPGTGGEGVSCDAISLGVSFRGVRGHLAGIAAAAPPPNACEAMMGDAGAPGDAGPGDAGLGDAGGVDAGPGDAAP